MSKLIHKLVYFLLILYAAVVLGLVFGLAVTVINENAGLFVAIFVFVKVLGEGVYLFGKKWFL